MTGAALNPCRVLGPLLIAMSMTHYDVSFISHWVYFIAPIFGALLAGFYYEFFMLEEEEDDEEEDFYDEEEEAELKL